MTLPTPAQKNLVQQSWKSLVDRNALDSTGVNMFTRLFTQHPELLSIFPFGDLGLEIHELKEHPKFAYHAGRVMKTVGTAVNGLDNVEALIPKLESLGKRHKKYKAKPEYFQAVGDALIFALSEATGDAFDEEHKLAWGVVFAVVSSTMKTGLLS
ncbi:neuroglobin-like [Anneissia japonica]|uniref:neuroglobin-like n=1 Tax=Anneissia japonica TaxID=1529436 RepID=UPI0014256026|nr:neuroglobin-like [Anneissia japonica]